MGGRRPSHGVWLALAGTSPSNEGANLLLLPIAESVSQQARVTFDGATPAFDVLLLQKSKEGVNRMAGPAGPML